MNKCLIQMAFATLLASSVQAQEENMSANTPPAASLPKLASLTEPGEEIATGDMITMSRAFDGWSLRCDYRLSQNKRLCSIDQALSNGQSSLVWRIANSVDDRALLILSADPRMVTGKGMRMAFSGLEKTIGKDEWLCGPAACLTGFMFEGFLQAAIANAADVRFTFTAKSPDDKEMPVELLGSMNGFALALKAGATDPFGKMVVAQKANQAEVKEVPKEADKPQDQKAAAPAAQKPETLADAKPTPKRRHPPERQQGKSQLY